MSKEEIIKYIIFSEINGLGPISQNILLDISDNSIEKCFDLDADDLLSSDIVKKIGKKRVSLFIDGRINLNLREQAENIYSKCIEHKIRIITREDADFPKRFNGISDAPILLYVKGKLSVNDYVSSTGVIGARRCSQEGKQLAIAVTYDSLCNNKAVISGMAKGIDSYAHTAVIKNGGYTIAVLGNGVDICYPAEHQALYEKIEMNGCLLSEYPPGTKPRQYMFPRRNRIIAALSDELFVIEVGEKSGTSTTVADGEKYGREVKKLLVSNS